MPINVRDKRREQRSWERNLRRLEAVVYREASKSILRFWREASKRDNYGVALEDLRERLISMFELHYRRTARIFGKRVFDTPTGKSFAIETKLSVEEFVTTLSAWISERALFASNVITGNVRERVVRVLVGANNDGLGEKETTKRILETGAIDSVTRARTIARTETHQAAVHAQREAINELGLTITTHEWLAASDERTRPTHAAASGQVKPFNQPFEVGDSLLIKPGDGSLGAPASELINCRCVELFET